MQMTLFCGNMKRYRRRRRYRRLRNAVTNEQNAMVSMGKRLKFGKIRVTPMLQIKEISAFVLVSTVFIPIGVASLFASRDDPKFTRNQRSIFALNYIPLRLSHPHINCGETKFRQASMEWYSYQRRISSSSSRGCPYRRLDNFVTAYDEEEDNEKSAVVLRQRQISDLNFKYTKRRGISKLPQKIMSSIVLLKRCRDAYVEVMLSFAEHVVQLNGGNSYL
ncbi:hypothetical protein ACFX13_040137 [Malus domestica]